MSKARAEVTRTLRDPARRRPVAAVAAAIAAVALITGVILGTGFSGSSRGASTSSKPSGSATVQRRDLVETDTESGTLGYADSQTVFNRLSGTITALPNIGQVVKAGGTLYDVDGAPVVLMNGSVPAYRTLQAGVSDGLDVQQLKQNLVNLGFDAEHQITINQTFDAATTAAVERWQGSLGETENGIVTLGQVVFLSGDRRITAVDTVLGSTGGSGASSSGASSSSASGASTTPANTTSLARTTPAASRPEFVSLTTTDTTTTTTTTSTSTSTSTSTNSTHSRRPSGGSGGNQPASTLAALIALLRAETAELQKSRSGSATTGGSAGSRTASGTSSKGSPAASRSSSGGSGGSAGARGSSAASSAGGASSGAGGASSSSSAGAGAQAILGTTSTQLVVTVQLDATKQSEAVVGQPVSVELPDGSVAGGKITEVSPVAQTSSSSSSSASGSGAGGGSSAPSATIPVTITLTGHGHVAGLDQAAVSVNFQQQKATNVLSVPVSALLATAGGGYAVQEADAPHRLIPVTPGLFAAGFVQVSGDGIYPGLAVTDSQG